MAYSTEQPPKPLSTQTRSVRAHTSPWPSVESLNASPRPVLKKRHSAHADTLVPQPTPTVPDFPHPPIRPPRHPGRLNSFASAELKQQPRKSGVRRPSTTTGPSEPSTPREGPTRDSSDVPSIKSRTSSVGFSSYTGPVEEVTPWELYPVPISPTSTDARASTTPSYPKDHKSLSSTSMPYIPLSPHKSTLVSTGPVEDVTPWELLPGPSRDDDKPASAPSHTQIPAPPLPPPRRPSAISDHISVPVYPRSTATGPAEDVTPWELVPVPAKGHELEVAPHAAFSSSSRTRSSLSLTMAQLEQVTPWELYPAPKPSGSNLSNETQMTIGTTRPSSNKSLPEVGHRPRRSTASKSSKATRSSSSTGILNTPQLPIESAAFTRGVASNGASTNSPTYTITPHASTSASKKSYHDPKQTSSNDKQDLKFSTADRTILEQLKMNIRAREAQFVVKGIGSSVVGGGKSPGKKHHSYSAKEVPYPRSYGQEVVDLDVWETMFCLDICESLTWHVFEAPPTKVLEIGCGTGTWILRCAQNWKDCHFVGLDIVPLHPDLQNVGSSDLASRITWVQHNFLNGLPFQNEEFDFVHIKRIALGVPEDKWDKLFEEIARVMKPGAAFEMIEEDLFFPGKCVDDNDEDSTRTYDSLPSLTHWNSPWSDHRHNTVNGHAAHDDALEQGSHETPTTNTAPLPVISPRSNSPVRDTGSRRRETEKQVVVYEEQIPYDSSPSPSVPAISVPSTPNADPMPFPTISKGPDSTSPQSQPSSPPLLSIQTEQSHSESGVMGTHPGLSSISLLGAIGTVNDISMSRARSSSVQTSNTTESNAGSSSLNLTALSDSELKQNTKQTPFLLRMLTQSPRNPRDHTLLETIWNEMLSSRWVNLSPLSLLTTCLQWHFKDVRTHPPLMYTFPPKPEPTDDDVVDSDSDLDMDGTPNIASLRPKRHSSVKSNKLNHPGAPRNDCNGEFTEEHRRPSLQSQQQQSSSYVTLDGTRGNAYPPSQKTSFTVSKAREGNSLAAKRMSRLPSTTLNIDLRTLNLHLVLRAKEILACSESMWEWVEEFQQVSQTSVPCLNTPNNWSLDVTRCAILEMTREDFDHILNNFALDSQDQAAVGHALEEQFYWHVVPSRPSQDRKVFDQACRKYNKWVLTEHTKSSYHNRNGKTMGTRKSFSTPNINPSPHYSSTAITRSHSSPQANFQNGDDDATWTNDSPSGSHLNTQLTPPQRLSRSMRVFVAWKASL